MTAETRPIYRFAGFNFDPDMGSLRMGADDIALRPKSLELLAYLLQNAGRVVPKHELMDAVWPNVTVTEDSLTQCVHDIRRAIADREQRLIRTVPRRGYFFSGEILKVGPSTLGEAAPSKTVLSQRPSIAVLPFGDRRGSQDEVYFSDGFAEEIIASLSRFKRFFVIAHNTTLTYSGRSDDPRVIGRELDVRYVLCGGIRRVADQVRVNVHLIEVDLGVTLWAEHYDGERSAESLFDLQDQISRSVVGAIVPQLIASEIERSARKRPDNMEAYDLYLRAQSAVRELTRQGNYRAVELTGEALRLEPNYAVASGLAALALSLRVAQGWQTDPAAERKTGIALGRHAVAAGLQIRDAEALAMGGFAVAFLGEEFYEGLAAIEDAIEINPSSAQAFTCAGWVRSFLGEASTAIEDFEMAIRLSPRNPKMYEPRTGLAYSFLLLLDFGRAVDHARAALHQSANYTPARRVLASALGQLGRFDEAGAVVRELKESVPDLTIGKLTRESVFRHCRHFDVILEGLRRAGLPE